MAKQADGHGRRASSSQGERRPTNGHGRRDGLGDPGPHTSPPEVSGRQFDYISDQFRPLQGYLAVYGL